MMYVQTKFLIFNFTISPFTVTRQKPYIKTVSGVFLLFNVLQKKILIKIPHFSKIYYA